MATCNGPLRLKLSTAPLIAIDSSVLIDLLGDDARADLPAVGKRTVPDCLSGAHRQRPLAYR